MQEGAETCARNFATDANGAKVKGDSLSVVAAKYAKGELAQLVK